jgi:hypothetical protein
LDNTKFYQELFASVEEAIGPIDRDTIVAIVGFDLGGPLNFCTIGRAAGGPFVTYVSCELAVRDGQLPGELGRYELLASCDDEKWVRSILSDIGRMSFDAAFGPGHTLDIGPWVEPSDAIQGVVFEKAATAKIDGTPYGILRCIGVTRPELVFAQRSGVPKLLRRLAAAGMYPHTAVSRKSVV